MQYQFYTCDVFTDTRFGGNPLAVLPDARGLSGEQMQRIAREFNFSESTFVLPAEQGQTWRVRIFSREKEYPFAGHPNIGTAFVLAATGAFGQFGNETAVVFEELAGLVPLTVRRDEDGAIWCELKAPETLSLGEPLAVAQIAAALSLDEADVETAVHPPQVASVGLPFVITQLKSRDALARARSNWDVMREIAGMGIRPSFYIYTPSDDAFDIRCRMFSPLNGTIEDPATGSANCALVGLLTHYSTAQDGEFSWRIAQGVEMGRPSVLNGRSQKASGSVAGVWLGGQSVMVTEGKITV